MKSWKAISTPMATKLQLLSSVDDPFLDPTLYRSIVGSLQYLIMIHPDIAFEANTVCQFMDKPKMHHYQAVKRILRYINGIIDYGIRILANSPIDLYAFSDADWTGCPNTRRSTTGLCAFLGGNCLSWSAKQQPIVARSSTEVEYWAMASIAAELTWLGYILRDIDITLYKPPTLFWDNISALYMTINLVFHARTKHIEIDYHSVCKKVALGSLVTKFINSDQQITDIFTKLLPRAPFSTLRTKLGLWPLSSSLKGSNND